MRFAGLTLYVRDGSRMFDFYEKGLGLHYSAYDSRADYSPFALGHNLMIGLQESATTDPGTGRSGESSPSRAERPLWLEFVTPDIRAARERAIAHGATMAEITPGYRPTCEGVDPEGNPFLLIEVRES